MSSTAIIYTTMLRPELAQETIQSIQDNLPDNSELCIIEQGNELDATIHLPFDAGLSASRNAGIDWAHDHGHDWCLITADSIKFTEKYDFTESIASGYDLIGFELNNRVSWEGELWFNPNASWSTPFKVNKDYQPKINGIFKEVDICRNFFIVSTEKLCNVRWDKDLKLKEHEDFFHRWKLSGYSVAFTDTLSADYIDHKPQEYLRFRDRMYSDEFCKILRDKWSS